MRRRAAIDEIFTEDSVFYDPKSGAHRGRDEIDHVAGAITATHPDFRYQPIADPEESGNGGMVKWVAGRPGSFRGILLPRLLLDHTQEMFLKHPLAILCRLAL